MKTLPQIAKELSVATTTLRYRTDQCEQFIPYKKSGKDKLYNEEAELIIKDIHMMYDAGMKTPEILDILASKYSRNIEIVNEQLPQTTNEQSELMTINERIMFLMEYMAQMQNDIREQNELQRKQDQQEREKIRQEMDELKKQIAKLSKPWWKVW